VPRRLAGVLATSSQAHQGQIDVGLGGESQSAPLVRIDPQGVLLDLAVANRPLPALRRLFYGAETLNATERAFVTKRLGRRPDPIYQATEGFLGAPCRLGTLHLNEDAMIIERAPLGGDPGLVDVVFGDAVLKKFLQVGSPSHILKLALKSISTHFVSYDDRRDQSVIALVIVVYPLSNIIHNSSRVGILNRFFSQRIEGVSPHRWLSGGQDSGR
jgi:hypothetical protein